MIARSVLRDRAAEKCVTCGKSKANFWHLPSKAANERHHDFVAPITEPAPRIEVTDEMVERAARAVFLVMYPGREHAWPGVRELWLEHGRAALEAALNEGSTK